MYDYSTRDAEERAYVYDEPTYDSATAHITITADDEKEANQKFIDTYGENVFDEADCEEHDPETGEWTYGIYYYFDSEEEEHVRQVLEEECPTIPFAQWDLG